MKRISKLEAEIALREFTATRFRAPTECNLEQIRGCIQARIKTTRATFNYVPDRAYALLAAYNARLMHYCSMIFEKPIADFYALHPLPHPTAI